MAVWPFLYAVGDYLQGVLLPERNTRPIGIAKSVGVLISIGLVKLLVGTAATPSATAAIAVAGMAAGAVAETLVMYGLRMLDVHGAALPRQGGAD